MAEHQDSPADAFSDDALVARLYELASQMTRGGTLIDRDELARIDAAVYRRLEQAYTKDPRDGARLPVGKQDS